MSPLPTIAARSVGSSTSDSSDLLQSSTARRSPDPEILESLTPRKRVRLLNFLGNKPEKGRGLSNGSGRFLLLSLTISCSLGQVASTIYVPSVPAIASALETSVSRVQLTFVAYLAAFAVSMLVLGPLSDRCGRRRTMILGISLSALGSITCAASPTIEFLIGARILQGVGLSAGMVVGRATIRDLYGEDGAAQIIAGLSIVLTLLQAFAPIPGGYLQAWIGWRANFAAVAILAVAALALVLRYVPESSPREGPSRPETAVLLARTMLAGYRSFIQTRPFVAYAPTP